MLVLSMLGCPAEKRPPPCDATGDTGEVCDDPTGLPGPHSASGSSGATGGTGATATRDSATGETGDPTPPRPDTGLAREGDDAYETPANQPLEVPAPGVLANDPVAQPAAVVGYDALGSAGGTLALDPDGGFRYTPPRATPAVPYTERFRYDVAGARDSFFDIFLEVTITTPVHVVDNTATGPADGTAAHPWPTLADGLAAAAPGDVVHVRAGDGTSRDLGPADLPPTVTLVGSPCAPCGSLDVPEARAVLSRVTVADDVSVSYLDLVADGGGSALVVDGASGVSITDVTLSGDLEVTGSSLTASGLVVDGDVSVTGSAGSIAVGLTGHLSVADSAVDGVYTLDESPNVVFVGGQRSAAVSGSLRCEADLPCFQLIRVDTTSMRLTPTEVAEADLAPLIEVTDGVGPVTVDLSGLSTPRLTGPLVRLTGSAHDLAVVGLTAAGAPGSDAVEVIAPVGGRLTLEASEVAGWDRGVVGVLAGADDFVLQVDGGRFAGLGGSAIEVNATADAHLDVSVRGTEFADLGGAGVNLGAQDDAVLRVLVEGATFRNLAWDGVSLVNFGGGGSVVDATLQLNTLDGTDQVAVAWNRAPLFVSGVGGTTCARVDGNTVTGTPAPYVDLHLRSRLPGVVAFYDPIGVGAVAGTDVLAVNTAATATVGDPDPVTFTNAACPLPR